MKNFIRRWILVVAGLAAATPAPAQVVQRFEKVVITSSATNALIVTGGTVAPTIGPTAARQHTLPDVASDTVVLLNASQVLASKTLTTPTIASFVNATHAHQDAAGGGSLDAAAIGSGSLALARIAEVLALANLSDVTGVTGSGTLVALGTSPSFTTQITTPKALINSMSIEAGSASGDLYFNGGNIGVGTATPNIMGLAGGSKFITIFDSTRAMLELARNTDTDGNTIGEVVASVSTQSTSDKRVGEIRWFQSGTTSNNRGSRVTIVTRADGASTVNSNTSFEARENGVVGLNASGASNSSVTIGNPMSATNALTLSSTSSIFRFSGSGGVISMSGGGSWVATGAGNITLTPSSGNVVLNPTGNVNSTPSGDVNLAPTAGHVVIGGSNDGIVYMPGPGPVTGTTGALYIGNNSPDLTGLNTNGVIHLQSANGNSSQIIATTYGANNGFIVQRRAGGTFASPTALATDDIIGGLAVRGYGTAFLSSSDAAINFKAAETFDGTHHGSYITFETTPAASTTRAVVGMFTQGGQFIIGAGASSGNIRLGLNGSNVLQIANGAGSSGIRVELGGILRFSAGASVSTSGGAGSSDQSIRTTTAIPNNSATTIGTITIPNGAHSATIEVTIHATMGAGGAIGENEASADVSYLISVTRTTGVNAVASISTGFGAANSNVLGGGSITLTGTLAAVSGGVGASNSVALQATVVRSGGSSTNHKVWLTFKVINANASGVTMST